LATGTIAAAKARGVASGSLQAPRGPWSGITITALAWRCRVEHSVMSRYVSNLSTYNRHHKDGLQLITITRRIYGDRRERRVVLTERGRDVARQIATALRDPGASTKEASTNCPGQTLTTPYRGSYGSGAIASVTLTKVWKTRACFSSSGGTDDWEII